MSGNHIKAIYEDRSGVIWVGTHDNGLNRIGRDGAGQEQFKHYRHEENDLNSLSDNYVTAIYEDRSGTLWVGTDQGLNKLDRKREKFTRYRYERDNPNSLSHHRIRTIYEDNSGLLWIGTRDGLNRLDREKETFTHYKNEASDPHSLSSSSIRVIYEDRSGLLWVGTDGGLNKFCREKHIFKGYQKEAGDPNSLSYDRVRSIYEDKAGRFWIGTRGGLNKFDREAERFRHYTEKDGLISSVIYCTLEDEGGYLWISTPRGLSRFDPQDESFRNFTTSDGLLNEIFEIGSYCQSKSGEMFFGGTNGIDIFHPDKVQINRHKPPVVITGFRKYDRIVKFDKDITEIKEIELSYKDDFISFEFVAIDYVNPEENQYAYKLENFDKDWVYCGNSHFAKYTNLDAGDYIFTVKGSNNDGIWNEKGASVKITIPPPFWKTLWFRISVILLSIYLIISLFRLRVKSIDKHRKELETKVAARTYELSKKKEIVEKTNKDLAKLNHRLKDEIKERQKAEEISKAALREKEILLQEINHRTKNNFQLISSLLNLQSRNIVDKDIQKILKNTKSRVNSIALVHEILYKARSDIAEIDFSRYVKDFARLLFDTYKTDSFPIRLSTDIEDIYLDIKTAIPCGLVINELISNSLQHAFTDMKEGEIAINMRTKDANRVEIVIRDNGIGFPEDLDFRNTKSMGMQLVTTLVDQINGSIALQTHQYSPDKRDMKVTKIQGTSWIIKFDKS